MAKPQVIVFTGYGLNSEEELAFAFHMAGARADIVHINDVVENKKILKKYQILAFPGGFSYGDDTGSGNAYAGKLKNYLWNELYSFVQKDHLVIGICNGFQVMVNLGLLPALERTYGRREVALLANDNARYTVRWTDIEVTSNTPWLKGMQTLSLPIAHGEGKLYASDETLKHIKRKQRIAARYVKGEMYDWSQLPMNPTGTIEDIAALTDETGRVLGIMPHPERALFFTQLPNWTFLKESYIRVNKPIPSHGPGWAIFQNAVSYFS